MQSFPRIRCYTIKQMKFGGKRNKTQTFMTTKKQNQQIAQWAALYGAAVRGYILSMVRKPELADDLSQEVFLRAWKSFDQYTEQGEAKAFLMKIAYRTVCNSRRKTVWEVSVDDETWSGIEPADVSKTPEQSARQKELGGELSRILDKLSESEKRVLTLRYYGEMKFNEIADLMELPLNTVLSHAHRGLAKMRDLMTNESNYYEYIQ